jgi:hypothetical protein
LTLRFFRSTIRALANGFWENVVLSSCSVPA